MVDTLPAATQTLQISDGEKQPQVVLEPYTGEHQMKDIIELIEQELSEPYIVYTYRYFVNQWPNLCFLARTQDDRSLPVGVIVCKLDQHLKGSRRMRGYIAMISVRESWRRKGLAKQLVKVAIKEMIAGGAQEVVLETEADNSTALHLYQGLGFIREKRLHRFYLNGKDSFRLVLPIPSDKQCPVPVMDFVQAQSGLIQPPNHAVSRLSDDAII